MKTGRPVHHGVAKPVGCSHAGFGAFTRMIPLEEGVDAFNFFNELLSELGSPSGIMHDQTRDREDSPLPAAYTFFAQFVDHDVTLDTVSQLNHPLANDPAEVKNQRTPSLDLDCVYGLGPETQPLLYDGDRAGFLADGSGGGQPWDLARSTSGVALIGDPRNDENLIVSQMQLLWIRFHNLLMLTSPGAGSTASRRFKEVQRRVRHHDQSIVLHDFLRRVCHEAVYDFALERILETAAGGAAYPLVFQPDGSDHGHGLPMPIEFSVAAYRFGHTTVRDAYPANAREAHIELFDEEFGVEGFSALPERLEVDWCFQLPVEAGIDPTRAKAFDHLLPDELMRMPDPIVGATSADHRSLAFRNLARGRSSRPRPQLRPALRRGRGRGLRRRGLPGRGRSRGRPRTLRRRESRAAWRLKRRSAAYPRLVAS